MFEPRGAARKKARPGERGCIELEFVGLVCSILACCSSSPRSASRRGRADRVKANGCRDGLPTGGPGIPKLCLEGLLLDLQAKSLVFQGANMGMSQNNWNVLVGIKGARCQRCRGRFRSGNSRMFSVPQSNKSTCLCQLAQCKAAGF